MVTYALTVEVNGQAILVRGKVAQMIHWLARNASRLNAIDRGSVRFDFSNSSVKPSCTEVWEALKVK